MGLQILIVEDDESFLKLVEIRLKSWRKDASITAARTLAEAREALTSATAPFDLIILDQNLPDGLGRELLLSGSLDDVAVLAVSSDESPDLPGAVVRAGAHHFLKKVQVREPLFLPLVEAIIERQRAVRELVTLKIRESKISSIKTLLATLRHEINNPLGAVLGAAFLLRAGGHLDAEQLKTVELVEASGNRIKHVVKELCLAADLEEVAKANEKVFHVPGDPAWGKKD